MCRNYSIDASVQQPAQESFDATVAAKRCAPDDRIQSMSGAASPDI